MKLSKRILELAKKGESQLGLRPSSSFVDFSTHEEKLRLWMLTEGGLVIQFGYYGNPSLLKKAIFEAIGVLSKKKAFWFMADLSANEVKSFLKDRNDLPAFSSDFNEEFNETLSLLPLFVKKVALEKALLISKELGFGELKKLSFPDFIERIVSHFEKVVIPLLGEQGPLKEIYQWDPPYLTFGLKGNSCPKILFEILKEVYFSTFYLEHLNLVAVEEKSI